MIQVRVQPLQVYSVQTESCWTEWNLRDFNISNLIWVIKIIHSRRDQDEGLRLTLSTHLNGDALTPVLLLKTTREEIHEGLRTEVDVNTRVWDCQINNHHVDVPLWQSRPWAEAQGTCRWLTRCSGSHLWTWERQEVWKRIIATCEILVLMRIHPLWMTTIVSI